MKGEYKIDETKSNEYLRPLQIKYLLWIVPFTLFFFVIGLFLKEKSVVFIFGALSLLIIVGYYITPYIYSNKNNTLSKVYIILGENELIRQGEGIVATKIMFDDIENIKENETGILVFRKGSIYLTFYRFTRYYGLSDPDIIWIPKQIEKYSEMKDFLFDKFYSIQYKKNN